VSFSTTDPLQSRAGLLLLKNLPPNPTLWLKPPADTQRHNPEDRFVHPWYPEHQRLLTAGWTPWEGRNRWPQAAVFGGKHKEENRRLIVKAQALAHTVYFVIPNDYGAKSFQKELEQKLGLQRIETGKKSRLFTLSGSPGKPVDSVWQLEENEAGLKSCPGLFSWDRVDRGSQHLTEVLQKEPLRGPVADLGAGWGYLSRSLPEDLTVHLLEADKRGLEASERNLNGRDAHFHWCDVTDPSSVPKQLAGRMKTVITNPPFHTGKKAEPVLGEAFAATAHRLLRQGGKFYLVGNVHLPYYRILHQLFSKVESLFEGEGFRILRGTK